MEKAYSRDVMRLAILASLLCAGVAGERVGGAWENVRVARVVDLRSHVPRVNVSIVLRSERRAGQSEGEDGTGRTTRATPYRAVVPVAGDQRLAHFAAFRVVASNESGENGNGLVPLTARPSDGERNAGHVGYDLLGVLPMADAVQLCTVLDIQKCSMRSPTIGN